MTEKIIKKKWYYSKTVWVNLLILAALLLQVQFGFVLDASQQLALLTAINIILRVVTQEEIEWSIW